MSTADGGLEPRELGYWLSVGSSCCFHQGPKPPLAVPTYRQVTEAEIEALPNNKAEAVAPAGSRTLQETKVSSNCKYSKRSLGAVETPEPRGRRQQPILLPDQSPRSQLRFPWLPELEHSLSPLI